MSQYKEFMNKKQCEELAVYYVENNININPLLDRIINLKESGKYEDEQIINEFFGKMAQAARQTFAPGTLRGPAAAAAPQAAAAPPEAAAGPAAKVPGSSPLNNNQKQTVQAIYTQFRTLRDLIPKIEAEFTKLRGTPKPTSWDKGMTAMAPPPPAPAPYNPRPSRGSSSSFSNAAPQAAPESAGNLGVGSYR